MNVDGHHGAAALSPTNRTMERSGYRIMEIDKEKIDDAILALLFLSLDRDGRSWKGFDWDAMNRLHEKGYISNPISKAKSVISVSYTHLRAHET